MFTFDGASVTSGKTNCVTARLRIECEHLSQQHSIAHREDLGIDDAWSKIVYVNEIKILLRTIYMCVVDHL